MAHSFHTIKFPHIRFYVQCVVLLLLVQLTLVSFPQKVEAAVTSAILTIDATYVDSTLTDFPVYVDLSDMPASFWSGVAAGCGDIRVFASDNSTELPREVVSCNTGTDTGELHFKADSISSSVNTIFYIHWDGTSSDYAIDATYGAENVWTNNYVMVQHLNEGDSTATDFYKDSTSNDHDGTLVDANANSVENTTSKLGNGVDFNGDADTIDIDSLGGAAIPTTGNVSVWMKRDVTSGQTRVVGINDAYEFRIQPTTGEVSFEFFHSGGGVAISSGNTLSTSAWYHLSANYIDGGTITGYIDGAADGTGTGNGANPSGAALSLGSRFNTKSDYVNGTLDEIRVSSVNRSAAWISAEYANQDTPDLFYSTAEVAEDGSITISGTLYQNDGVTPITTGKAIKAVISTSTPSIHAATTDGSGGFSISEIATSTVGSWSGASAVEATTWKGIAYGNGRFVAVANSGTNRVMYSNNGTSWSAATAAEANGWNDVIYAENMFVAIAEDGTNRIMVSSNGVDWSAVSGISTSPSWDEIEYAPDQDMYVAFDYTQSLVSTSSNLTSWSTPVTAASLVGGESLSYGDGTWLITSSGSFSSGRIRWSADADVWASAGPPSNFRYRDTVYGGGRWVAVSDNAPYILTSVTGRSGWSNVTPSGLTTEWHHALYANGRFVLLSETATSSEAVLISEDGLTWQEGSGLDLNTWSELSYGNGRFVAVSSDGTNRVAYADGGLGVETPITLYVDGETEDATTLANGFSSQLVTVAGLDLYQDTVRLQHVGTSTTSSIKLSDAHFYDADNDADILFDSDIGSTTINGDLEVTSNTTLMAPKYFDISGDVALLGSFMASDGEVRFSGGDQVVAIAATTTFHDVTAEATAARTLTFTSGEEYVFTGDLVLTGAAGQLTSLAASTPGTEYFFKPYSSATADYLSVRDSHNISTVTTPISCFITCYDDGNNLGWSLPFVAYTGETYTFDADNDEDEDAWIFVTNASGGTSGLNPENTAASWSHEVDGTNSNGDSVGPLGGQGGNPDGYVYTEASSAAAGDTFTMTLNKNLNAAVYDWEVSFYWNQRGDDNLATVQLQTNEDGAGWVTRGTFAESGPDVAFGGTSRWNLETVDLSSVISDPLTEVRFLVTLGSTGTIFQNDFGLDTITLTGTGIPVPVTIDDHDDTQVSNAFTFANKTNETLFAFQLDPSSATTINQIIFDLTGVKNIDVNDFSNLRLYKDHDNDAQYDVSDEQVSGSGVMALTGLQDGTITFTGSFEATSSTNYIVVADWNAPENGSYLTINLRTFDIIATASGIPVFTGTVRSVQHYRGNQGGGGGGGGGGLAAIIDDVIEGAGEVVGGGDGGGGEIGEVDGVNIVDNPNFNKPSAHSGSWSNGANVYESDGSYASSLSPATSHSFSSFGFTIPGTNAIVGIEVKLDVSYSGSNAPVVSVSLSHNDGSNYTTAKSTDQLFQQVPDTLFTLGGPSDVWGRTWTPAQFANGNFRVLVSTDQDGTDLDAIQVRVYHQATGGGGGGGGAI